MLVNHAHLTDPTSPCRAAGPIFVREAAVEAGAVEGQAPEMLAKRLLSLRVYDGRNMITEAEVIEGRTLDARLAAWFDHPTTEQIHIHFAPRGCYLARAVRAWPSKAVISAFRSGSSTRRTASSRVNHIRSRSACSCQVGYSARTSSA